MLIKQAIRVILIGVLILQAEIGSAARVNPNLESEINTLSGNILNKTELIKTAKKAAGKLNQSSPQENSLKADVDLAIAHLENEVTKMYGQLNALNDLADTQKASAERMSDMKNHLETQTVKQLHPLTTRDPRHTENLQRAISTASNRSNSSKNQREYQIASTFLTADPQSNPPKPVPNNQYDSVNNLSDDNNNYQSATDLQAMQARREQRLQLQAEQQRQINNTYESANQALDAPLSNNNSVSNSNNVRPVLRRQANQKFNQALPAQQAISTNQAQQNSAVQQQQNPQLQQQSQPPVRHNQFQQQPSQPVSNNNQYQQTSAVQQPRQNQQIQAIPAAPRIQKLPDRPLPPDPTPDQTSVVSNNNQVTRPLPSGPAPSDNRPLPPSNRPLPPGSPPATTNQQQFSAINNQPRRRPQNTAVQSEQQISAVQSNGQPRRRLGTTNAAVQSTSSQAQQISAGPRQRNTAPVQSNSNQDTEINYGILPPNQQAENNQNTDQNYQAIPPGTQVDNNQNTTQDPQVTDVGLDNISNSRNNKKNNKRRGKK